MENTTIFTSAYVMPGTSVLHDVDRRGLQLAGRARAGEHMPMRGAGVVRVQAEAYAGGVNAFVKQLKTPVVTGIAGEVGPHPGRPPI